MPDKQFPTGDDLVQYARNTITLRPEKFGVMGAYSRELLQADIDHAHMFDQLTYRLTTSVLSGRTISENPQVELNLPATWWQHLKYTAILKAGTVGPERVRWWHWLYLWAAVLMARAILFGAEKRPVKWTKVTADVKFRQSVLYPEIDMSAQAGRPVIYETLDVSWPGYEPPFGSSLVSDPSRFLNKHEIISQFRRDPAFAANWGRNQEAFDLVLWLERHGVNVDQLVKRR